MQALSAGTLLQHETYRIEKVLGQGGFGITYLATDLNLQRKIAIKEFFPKDFCDRDETTSHVTLGTKNTAEFVNRLKDKFLKEARNIAKFDHPNIIRIYAAFEENNTAYYVMEYIDGESLSSIVKKSGSLAEQHAVDYIKKVGDALEYVHARKINHLDVKPANIMVRKKDDNPILIDFGLSKQYDDEFGENTSSLLGKTPGYAPPEQMSNKSQHFSPATDVYALGATLYKILTGITPPDASDRIAGEELPALPDTISKTTKVAISQALVLNKNARLQTVVEFLKQLEDEIVVDENETTIINTAENEAKPHSVSNAQGTHKRNGVFNYKQVFIAVILVVILGGVAWILSFNHSAAITREYSPETHSATEAIAAHNVADIRYYAENGSPEAAAALGDIYRWGLYGITDTLSKALEWYEKAFNLGDSRSAYKMGTMFLIMNHDNASKKASFWLTKAAEAGEKDAWFYLANNLRYNEDKSESYRWAHKADQAGDLKAKNLIAEGWYDGINPNYKKNAQKEMLELANSNNPEAIGYIAGLYMNGYMGHSPRDLNGSYPWALKGSKLKDANSTQTLGWYYYCIDDKAKAEEYFKIASELGSILAMASTCDANYGKKRTELLFYGEAVLTDGMGISNWAQYYESEADRDKWNRRATEYGWR